MMFYLRLNIYWYTNETITGPNSIAKCNIDPEANGIYTVTYVPVEVGLYDVQVKWNSKEIQGK